MNTRVSKRSHKLGAALLSILFSATMALGQGTSFTYQGRLTDGGMPANGTYDLQFALWDSLSGGAQIGSTQTVNSVSVANGIFTVTLDFGASAFPGASRFLEISARASGGGSFTTLSPRQQVTATPYAVRSLGSTSADALSSACTGCVTVGNGGTGLSSSGASGNVLKSNGGVWTSAALSSADLPTGSGNYIQNTTSTQSSSNFNIDGNGTAGGTLSGNLVSGNVVNATTQYNTAGGRFASAIGYSNTFVGLGTGPANTTGQANSFFGFQAGLSNTVGSTNAFFGDNAGRSNTTGIQNSFFGPDAGTMNGTGSTSSSMASYNSFFGSQAGNQNTTGDSNSFFGFSAGVGNTTARQNSFFGSGAGPQTTQGGSNSFFGTSAGFSNTMGAANSFFGFQAGYSNNLENNNTFVGAYALGGMAGISNATAIGAFASVTQSNSLVLGSIMGVNSAQASTNVGIGTTAPAQKLHVVGNSLFATSGTNGVRITPASNGDTGVFNVTNAANTASLLTVNGNGQVVMNGSGNVGIGTTGPTAKLHVNGTIRVDTFAPPANPLPLCWNNFANDNQLTLCPISSLRYKTNVKPFLGGLEIINRLRPISFTWKQSGSRDIGLGAEEVEKVAPVLTFRNGQGEIEGVKYSQLSAVFINAIKQQQAQIQQQQAKVKQQQHQIEALRTANSALNARLLVVEKILKKKTVLVRRRH